MVPPVTVTKQRILQDAVTEFSRATGFTLAFGGYEADGVTTVSALSGTEGDSLQGLRVANWRGLGGKAMIELRPRFTRDYMSSQTISHDYDLEIGAERIVMLVAVPVIVDGVTRAVLYGGTRGDSSPDATFMQAAAGVSEELARVISAEDRAQTQLRLPSDPTELPGSVLEELRSSHAEIRRIASETTDPVARERLAAIEQKLAGIGKPHTAAPEIHLTSREIDVLCQAALGGTNASIGQALGIAESTVKSYLKTAMGKLEAPTRHAAVTAARGYGLIP